VGILDPDRIKADFPIFVENPGLIYLDSAATSQRPRQVIDAVSGFYSKGNSNVARGLYRLAEEATLAYEDVRRKAGRFIGSPSEDSIVFTKNATEGANLIMRGWGERNIRKGDRIVTTVMEHHSNLVPWQALAAKKGAHLEVAGIGDGGMLDLCGLEKKLKGAKLFAFSAASNVIGTLNDTKRLCQMAHEAGAACVVDGAQSVPSMPTDVRKMDCDFLVFSGHKMLGPFGSGILYGRREMLERMDPFMYGSSMIREVGLEKSGWADIPQRFEAGTPLVDAAVGFGAALDYLSTIGMGEIRSHDVRLVRKMQKRLAEVSGLRMLGPADAQMRCGLVSFTLEGVHPHDVSAMLAESDICVRSGHHCAMPLHERLGIPASTRASVYIYNNEGELDALAEGLERARKAFG